MKCPQCQNEMSASAVGHLCLECGHIDTTKKKTKSAAKASAPAPAPTTAPVPAAVAPAEIPPTLEVEKAVRASASENIDPPEPEHKIAAHNRPKHRLLVAAPLLSVLLLVIGYFAYQQLYVAPAKKRLQAFFTKISSAQTAQFKGRYEFKGEDFLSGLTSNMAFEGQFDKSDSNNIRLKSNFDGRLGRQQHSGNLVISESRGYLQLLSPETPTVRYKQSSYQFQLKREQWYSAKIDRDLFNYYCEAGQDAKAPQPLLLVRLLNSVKFQNTRAVGLSEMIDGHKTTHFKGQIERGSLAEAVNRLNDELPGSCGLAYTGEDFKNMDARYDLWTSDGFDRIVVTLSDASLKAEVKLQIDLDGYNAGVDISSPENATDLGQLMQQNEQILTRDQTRRSDIDKIKAALNSYSRANNGRYPASLASLAPRHISVVPTDPKTKQAYVYRPASNRRSYDLSAVMEEPGASYSVKGP